MIVRAKGFSLIVIVRAKGRTNLKLIFKMRFHYFVPLPTSQDCLIPVIQFQQFIPEDRLAAPIRSTFSWMTTARICLTGVTLSVQHDLYCDILPESIDSEV